MLFSSALVRYTSAMPLYRSIKSINHSCNASLLISLFIRELRTITRSVKPNISSTNGKPKMDQTLPPKEMINYPPSELPQMETYKTRPRFEDFIMKYPLPSATTEEDQFKRLAEAVTPLHQMPYREQLDLKQRHFYFFLKMLRSRLKKVGAPLAIEGRLPCPVQGIIPSPNIANYRNKDEFSIHLGVDGDPKTVGFFVGLPTDSLMRCVPPTHLINLKESHKRVAQHFQSLIRSSRHQTCLKFSQGGVWRNIVVRSNLKGDLMAVIIIYPPAPEDKEEIKNELRRYFFSGPGTDCGLTSLYLQACRHSRCSRETAPYELVAGEPHLIEECLGRRFRISPDSFFQTNTEAAEQLYTSIRQVAEVSPFTTLLDICCGTGSASIPLASYCRSVMGIDVTSAAIEDARANAQENGIQNAHYINGKVEDVLSPLTKDLEATMNVVAIVNPSRAGLHASVVKEIRRCPSIKKIVFVSCKPSGIAMDNMSMLGCSFHANHKVWGKRKPDEKRKPADFYGSPFILRYAFPIDLFPQTLHTEYVLLFERYS